MTIDLNNESNDSTNYAHLSKYIVLLIIALKGKLYKLEKGYKTEFLVQNGFGSSRTLYMEE